MSVEHDTDIEDELVDDNLITAEHENAKSGVINEDIDDNAGDADDELTVPHELESDLGPYWTLAQSCHAYVLSTITSYSNIEASKSTPQYGFNRGLKEFGELGYEATVKELDDNLLRMGAVRMLKPSEMNNKIRFEALNYLMFLKTKRCGKIKARVCADGCPQREYITKYESSSPTVSIWRTPDGCEFF
jgi:hypothetical protein